MSVVNGKIVAPVNVDDISGVLGMDSSDIGYLIAKGGERGLINRFAKYKPVCLHTLGTTGEGSGNDYWRGEDGMCGLVIPHGNSGAWQKEWGYHYPGWNGDYQYPYRPLDFDGYKHGEQSVFEVGLTLNGHRLNDEETTVVTLAPGDTSVDFGIIVPSGGSDDAVLKFSDIRYYPSGAGFWVGFEEMPVAVHISRQSGIDGAVEFPDYEDRPILGEMVGSTYHITKPLLESMLVNDDLYATAFLTYGYGAAAVNFSLHKCVRLKFRITAYTHYYGQTAEFSNVAWSPVYAKARVLLTNGFETAKTARVVYVLDENSETRVYTLEEFTVSVPSGESVIRDSEFSHEDSWWGGNPWTISCLVYWDGSTSFEVAGEVISNQ